MAALKTVQDYVSQARVLLQDQDPDYRYPSADMVDALNNGLMEIRRIRPDLVIGIVFPDYTMDAPTAAVPLDQMYRVALLYFIIGTVTLRDDEETQDQRAAAFLNMFTSKLLTVAS